MVTVSKEESALHFPRGKVCIVTIELFFLDNTIVGHLHASEKVLTSSANGL